MWILLLILVGLVLSPLLIRMAAFVANIGLNALGILSGDYPSARSNAFKAPRGKAWGDLPYPPEPEDPFTNNEWQD